ncbi:MAG: hypothetical protein WA991_00490 [Ornithinimicrobium sp.]
MPTSPPAPRVALVRRPSPRLAEGLVTHIDRSPEVDVDLGLDQWARYLRAFAGAGYQIVQVEPAPSCPDGDFADDPSRWSPFLGRCPSLRVPMSRV